MEILKLTGINKYYGVGENRVHVLKDMNLSIEKGDFVAIMGQSGSGKSTLMNIIGCLDTPTDGSYKVDGTEAGSMSSDELAELRCKKFGFIFQRYNLLTNISAQENVALPAIYRGADYSVRMQRAKELLTDLGLDDKLKNRPNELSGGQQQRVSIARALMNGGEIILADEPTGALDSKSGENVMELIGDLHKKGHTIILVTHDRNIASHASRIIELKDGVVISDERSSDTIYNNKTMPKEIKKNPLSNIISRVMESFSMSVQAIMTHKMRSLLTMLGIIIGIASVVTVVALGRGSQQQILENISSIGTNTIDIFPGAGFGDRYSSRVRTLKVSDSEVLASQAYIDSSTPNVASSGTLVYANVSATAQINGAGVQYFDVKGIEVIEGRKFSADDVLNLNSVVVIDENTKTKLFPDTDPMGNVIMFNKKPLEVIGVAKQPSMNNRSSDSLVLYAPYTTVMSKITGAKNISSITVKIADDVNTQVAERNVIELLTSIHGKKDFSTFNSDTIKQTIESTTATMTLLISGIAFISLVVGGIGVMNIMLVSVTERTKEIGIRMAIGAKQIDVMEQFLIEAILLCVIGGFVGVLLSGAIGITLSKFAPVTLSFAPASIVLALCCSTAIGVIFGFMPARGASKLNPIDALARE